ncbi:MAG: hypothetical protein ACRD3W_15935 [Terriglobales bacterium]
MLKRIGLAIIFLALYQAIVSMHVLPSGQGIGVKQINLITATMWRSRTRTPAIAIVGSSRSGWMQPDYFSVDVANLGMHGNGAATGLEIIKRSPDIPPVIAVEISDASVSFASDQDVVSSALSTTHLPFGYEARPVNVLIGAICPLRTAPQYSEATLAQMRSARMRIFSRSLQKRDEIKLKSGAKQIRDLLTALEARGAHVYLFEEPMDKVMSDSQAQIDVRRILNDEFPPSRFHWLQMPNYNWQTADLIHLNGESSRQFAAALEQQVQHAEIAAREEKSFLGM